MRVYVPLPVAVAAELRTGSATGPLRGCAPTAALASVSETPMSTEEVEFVALGHAGVLALGLAPAGPRLVLAAEVADSQVDERPGVDGEVVVSGLIWSQVLALFADEPTVADLVARARSAAGTRPLAEALSDPAVTDLLAGSDLLWFAPDELDQLD